LLLEQLQKTCANAAAASGSNSAAAAAATAADCVALVDEATIFINERKRDAGPILSTCTIHFKSSCVFFTSVYLSIFDLYFHVILNRDLYLAEHLSQLRQVKLSFALQQHRCMPCIAASLLSLAHPDTTAILTWSDWTACC
jgi:hypothetical protein